MLRHFLSTRLQMICRANSDAFQMDLLRALQERVRERQRAVFERLMREGKHVLAGHPVNLRVTDLAQTFQRAREMQ